MTVVGFAKKLIIQRLMQRVKYPHHNSYRILLQFAFKFWSTMAFTYFCNP